MLLPGRCLLNFPLSILFCGQNLFYLFLFRFCSFLLCICGALFFVHHRTLSYTAGETSFAHHRRFAATHRWATASHSRTSHWRTLFAGVLHCFEMFFLFFQIQLIDFLVQQPDWCNLSGRLQALSVSCFFSSFLTVN